MRSCKYDRGFHSENDHLFSICIIAKDTRFPHNLVFCPNCMSPRTNACVVSAMHSDGNSFSLSLSLSLSKGRDSATTMQCMWIHSNERERARDGGDMQFTANPKPSEAWLLCNPNFSYNYSRKGLDKKERQCHQVPSFFHIFFTQKCSSTKLGVNHELCQCTTSALLVLSLLSVMHAKREK